MGPDLSTKDYTKICKTAKKGIRSWCDYIKNIYEQITKMVYTPEF